MRAVIAMGSSLGIATTAEGVETLDQFKQLKLEGCTEVRWATVIQSAAACRGSQRATCLHQSCIPGNSLILYVEIVANDKSGPDAVGGTSNPHPVQRLQVELIGGLCRHKLHRRPLHRLGDRLRITKIVLLFRRRYLHPAIASNFAH